MSRYPVRKGRLVQDSSDERWVIYESEADALHELNETARAIWELCDGETAPAEMAVAISEITGMDISESTAVVGDAIDNLASRKLISLAD